MKFLPITLILVVLLIPTVQAENDRSPDRKENSRFSSVREKKQEFSEKFDKQKEKFLEKRLEQKCAVKGHRDDKRIKVFEVRKDNHVKRYQNISERLKTLTEKLKANGQDTTNLEEHLKVLDAKISKYQTDRENFINKLKEAQEYDCGDSDGKYKQLIEESKSLQEIVIGDVKDIKNYFEEAIKEDIKALKIDRKDKSKKD